jgi:hypothetical protein
MRQLAGRFLPDIDQVTYRSLHLTLPELRQQLFHSLRQGPKRHWEPRLHHANDDLLQPTPKALTAVRFQRANDVAATLLYVPSYGAESGSAITAALSAV